MAITLDGNNYEITQTQYNHKITTPGATSRAVDFSVLRQTAGSKFANRYELTLTCTLVQVATLRTSFAKQTVGSNQLNFVDEEGFNWNPSAGSNNSTHAYSTGVYFVSMSEPKPMSIAGWNTANRYTVDIVLIPNAKGISS